MVCVVEGCDNKDWAKGLCHKHYNRKRKYGTVEGDPAKNHGSAEERFWRRVQKGNEKYCWLFNRGWGASKTARYAHIKDDSGATRAAHKFSYELHNGPVPEGLVVRHKCDNPWCVNPAHLELGTHADNIRDMDQRGRRVSKKGETHHNSKMTAEKVRAIRGSSETDAALAKRYGVGQPQINRIRNGRAWKHVT